MVGSVIRPIMEETSARKNGEQGIWRGRIDYPTHALGEAVQTNELLVHANTVSQV